MQKKIIASLLVSPLAFNAMANITLDNVIANGGTDWSVSGVTGDNTIFENGTFTCPVGGGVISQKITVNVPGTYRISINNPQNATVNATVDGKPADKDGGSSVTFTVQGKTVVTIEVSAVNSSEKYSFSGATIEIEFDFDAYKENMLKEANAAYKYIGFDADNNTDKAAELKKQNSALQVKLRAIRALINALDTEDGLKDYTDNELWTNPDKIAQRINDLKGASEALNEEINAENARFAIEKANKAAYEAIVGDGNDNAGEIGALNEALKKVLDAINNAETEVSEDTRKEYQNKANAIQAAIDAYKKAADEAYTDGDGKIKDTAAVDFESRKEAINSDITALGTDFANAVAKEALDKYIGGLNTTLSDAYAKAQQVILRGIDTIDGYPSVYSDLKSEWMRQLTEANTTATESLKESVDKEAAAAVVKTATAAFEQIVADAKALVKGQNDAMTAALGSIQSKQDSFDELTDAYAVCEKAGLEIDKDTADKYAAQVAVVKAAIEAAKDKIDGDYGKHEIAGKDYTEDYTAIQTEIDKLAKILSDANLSEKAEAQKALNDLIKVLENADKELELTGKDNSLFNKFNAVTIPELQKGVKDLTDDYAGSELESAIASNGEYIGKVVEAFTGVKAVNDDFAGSIDDLEKIVEAKYYNLGYTGSYDRKSNIDEQIADLTTTCKGWQDKYNEALAADAQICYELAKAIVGEMNQTDWKSTLNAAFRTFVRTVTEANNTVANGKLAEAKAKLIEILGETEANALIPQKLTETLNAIATAWGKTDANAANSFFKDDERKALVKTYGDIDEMIEAAMATIDNLYNNQKVYTELLAKVTTDKMNSDKPEVFDYKSVNTALDELTAYNNETSEGNAAKAAFEAKINGSDKASIKSQRDALVEDLKAQLKALTLEKNQVAVNTTIDNLFKQIADMKVAIDANEKSHGDQVAYGNSALNYVANYMAQMTMQDSGNFAQDWIDALTKLIDGDLAAADKAVQESYDGTTAAADDKANKDAYDAIKAKADEIWANFNGDDGFAKKIFDHNAEIKNELDVPVNKMDDVYKGAINSFNAYEAMNAGYRAFLTDLDPSPVITHEEVYKYTDDLRQLKSDLENTISDANTALKAVSEDEVKALEAEIKNLTDNINKLVEDMVAGYNDGGKGYYAYYQPIVKKALDDATADIKAAGLSDEDAAAILAEAQKHYDAAAEAYEKEMSTEGENAPNGANIGMVMSEVADEFDQVIPNIDLQAGAEAYWADEYKAASDRFAELKAELEAYKYQLEAQTEAFNAAVSGAAAENAAVAQVEEDLIKTVKTNLDNLAGYVKAAEDAVKDYNADQTDRDAAAAEYGTKLEDLNAALNDLKESVKTLGTTGDAVTKAEAAVKTVDDAIENIKSETALDTVKADIDGKIAAAEKAIEEGYEAALAAEIENLNELLSQAKVEYNNAFAASDSQSTFDFDKAKDNIDDLEKAISDLVGNDELTAADKVTEAVRIEKGLSEAINDLETTHKPAGETTLDKIKDELNVNAGEFAVNLGNATDALAGCEPEVQEKWSAEYEAIQSEIDEIQDAINNGGSELIGQTDNYNSRINALQEQLDELNKKVEADQAVAHVKAVSNARYAELKAEYDEINKSLADLNTMLGEYEMADDFAAQVANIEKKLAIALVALENAKDAYSLTEDSELAPEATQALHAIQGAALNAKKAYAKNLQKEANAKLAEVNSSLQSLNIVPEEFAKILEALQTLRNESSLLDTDIDQFLAYVGDKYEESLATIEGYIQQSEQIAQMADELLANANENSYLPGDVNGDGKVNITDVQRVMNYMMTAVGYDDLDSVTAHAADVTGDKEINISDVAMIVKHVFSGEPIQTTFALKCGKVESSSEITPVLVGEEDGVRTYEINLANSEKFVGGQFDLKVAAGCEIVDVTAADRISTHDLYVSDNNGYTRVGIVSEENAVIEGNDGATVYVQVRGRGGVGIENAIFADETAQGYALGDKTPGTTGIDSIFESAKAVKEAIYDAAGRAMKSMQRGINIIRHSDGTVTKELRK